MTDDQIRDAARQAIESVKAENPQLEFHSVHERSTAFRLAVHLEPLFGAPWNVDCEYDRDGQELKKLDGIQPCKEPRPTDRILPDIIVHQRLEQGEGHNLLVVELKKNHAEDACDRKKLELRTEPGHYSYQLGLYINIDGGKFTCTWYKAGTKQT